MRKNKKNKKEETMVVITPEKEEKEVKVKQDKYLNPVKGFKFWMNLIACALLLVVGLWIIFDVNFGAKISIGFTSVVVILLGVIRLIPLFRTMKSSKAKIITVVEVLIDVILGVFLFYVAINFTKDQQDKLSLFVNNYYKYFLGFVFYSKAVFYFINTSLLKEETTKFEFWIHILVITVACIVFALNFDATKLGYIIAALCLLSALFLGYESGNNYFKYRKRVKVNKIDEKEEIKEDNETLILPENDDTTDQIYS